MPEFNGLEYSQRIPHRPGNSRRAGQVIFPIDSRTIGLSRDSSILEIVDYIAILKKFKSWLNNKGMIGFVLPIESNVKGKISSTKYENLKKLKNTMNLINFDDFKGHLKSLSFKIIEYETINVKCKDFYVGLIGNEQNKI